MDNSVQIYRSIEKKLAGTSTGLRLGSEGAEPPTLAVFDERTESCVVIKAVDLFIDALVDMRTALAESKETK